MILCPKCKQPVVVPNGTDFVICCNEVIYVVNNVKLDDPKTMKIAFDSIKHHLDKNVPQDRKDEQET